MKQTSATPLKLVEVSEFTRNANFLRVFHVIAIKLIDCIQINKLILNYNTPYEDKFYMTKHIQDAV